jgi:glycosyltransferase involved in cell wall biosynthesis/SAM-dependent methyltransferase
MTWKNYYTPGVTEVSGVKVRRFQVARERNIKAFNQLSEKIYPRIKEASLKEQEDWMHAQGLWSPDLIEYVKQHHDEYDAFIFFTYLYATTYFILPLVAEKAYLAPLAHDEWPIYMSIWDALFEKPRGFIFNTIEERDFLKARFPNAKLDGPVVGVAIDPPPICNGERFRRKYNINEPFLLYVGRIDPSKGCEELFRYFLELRSQESCPRKLVLLGKPTMPIPQHPDILALGFVDEQSKWDALVACELLVMPSPYESLSMVLLEAWTVGKPVLVNGRCNVLVGQCRRARGGLWYTNQDEFIVALEKMDKHIREQLGLQGKSFVKTNYIWSKIEREYLKLIRKIRNNNLRYINNVQDLDKEIQKADARALISDDELRKALSEFCYVVDEGVPLDPYSQEYYDAQMKLYRDISGKKEYTLENEHTEFDFNTLKDNPFPYCTKSPTTVGDQLIAQGFLIKTLNLAPHSRIVEFGPGFGSTTLHFSQTGYQVTAVDCEQSFLDIIKYRAEKFSTKIDLVNQGMLDFQAEQKYDAAVFFECFHHCADHLKLLVKLHDLLNDNGVIAFAAEPIVEKPIPALPYPWGVRLDGVSVWSTRKFGWLELGFDASYFLRTLLLLGWTPKRYRSDASPLADVIIARKSHGYYEPSEITLPPDECRTWVQPEINPDSRLRFTRGNSVMTCAKNIEAKFVEFCISNYAPFALDVKLSAGHSSKTFRIPKSSSKGIYKLPIQDWNGKISISSKSWRPSKVLRTADNRELGVAIHSLRFTE